MIELIKNQPIDPPIKIYALRKFLFFLDIWYEKLILLNNF